MTESAPALTTWLWFDTAAEEAARFYCDVFEDSRLGAISHYGESGPRPAGMVMMAEFELNGQKFAALNGGPEPAFEPRRVVLDPVRGPGRGGLLLGPADRRRAGSRLRLADRPVRAVLAGHPHAVQQMMSDPDQEKVQRVMAAMLKMTKLDLPELQRAFDGD